MHRSICFGKGGLEDEDCVPVVTGFGSMDAENKYHLFDELNCAVNGPKHPGVIGDGGSGSSSREKSFAEEDIGRQGVDVSSIMGNTTASRGLEVAVANIQEDCIFKTKREEDCNEEKAPFDALQYSFFGKGVLEDEGLGGVEDQDDPDSDSVLGGFGSMDTEDELNRYHLLDNDEVKLNSAVTGPKHPGVIGDGGSGSFSRESPYKWFGNNINSSSHFEVGVKSYTSIMGFCIGKSGVIVADSKASETHGNLIRGYNDAVKVIQVAPLIGMIGAGGQHVFQEVSKRIDDTFRNEDSFDFSVKDVVDRVVAVIKESIECVKEKHPLINDYRVFYILLGRIHENSGCEMFEIYNGDEGHLDDSGIINSRKCYSRICYGGSGKFFLEEFERDHPPDAWVNESDIVYYCFEAMKYALKKDTEHSGGDICMVKINNAYNPLPFPVSYVHGHWPRPLVSSCNR